MKTPEISVIVPIYNTGNKLKKTLESIKQQSYSKFKCLLIDDGSNDLATIRICEKIVENDNRFLYFKKKNEGIELARLFGIEHSLSELLIFSDHDDYYEKNAFEILVNAYLKSNADIVISNCYKRLFHNINYRTIIKPNVYNEIIINKNEFIQNFYMNFFGINKFPVSTWGKLYKKQLFKTEIRTFGFSFMDDIIINCQIFERANKFHFVPNKTYTHIYGGLSSKFDFDKVMNGYNEIYDLRENLLEKYDLPITPILIEYKNVSLQMMKKLVENNCSLEDFGSKMDYTKSLNIYIDMLGKVEGITSNRYFQLMVNNEYDSLYNYIQKQNKSIKSQLKKNIKKYFF
ncbi:MAG: glycosyltransferase family 2 protein [Bergeyella sp.]